MLLFQCFLLYELFLFLHDLVFGQRVVRMPLIKVLVVDPVDEFALVTEFLPLFFFLLLQDGLVCVVFHLADKVALLIFDQVSFRFDDLHLLNNTAKLISHDAVDLLAILRV